MPSTFQIPESPTQEMVDASDSRAPSPRSNIPLIPSSLWNVPYLLQVPGALEAASSINPIRVAEVFAQSAPASQPPTEPITPQSISASRLSTPAIQSYDGSARSLRNFCSQLTNQIEDHITQFPTEMSKVRFAYQCLGPGALVKMRSYFRHLEDPSAPLIITSFEEFIAALKAQCQDPGLEDHATRTLESMSQKNMKFHDFITMFEDNLGDSTYAALDKAVWKKMLERRLSYKLRDISLSASDVPTEYYAFVAYLRKKDAAIQEMRAVFTSQTAASASNHAPFTQNQASPAAHVITPELTVSQ